MPNLSIRGRAQDPAGPIQLAIKGIANHSSPASPARSEAAPDGPQEATSERDRRRLVRPTAIGRAPPPKTDVSGDGGSEGAGLATPGIADVESAGRHGAGGEEGRRRIKIRRPAAMLKQSKSALHGQESVTLNAPDHEEAKSRSESDENAPRNGRADRHSPETHHHRPDESRNGARARSRSRSPPALSVKQHASSRNGDRNHVDRERTSRPRSRSPAAPAKLRSSSRNTDREHSDSRRKDQHKSRSPSPSYTKHKSSSRNGDGVHPNSRRESYRRSRSPHPVEKKVQGSSRNGDTDYSDRKRDREWRSRSPIGDERHGSSRNGNRHEASLRTGDRRSTGKDRTRDRRSRSRSATRDERRKEKPDHRHRDRERDDSRSYRPSSDNRRSSAKEELRRKDSHHSHSHSRRRSRSVSDSESEDSEEERRRRKKKRERERRREEEEREERRRARKEKERRDDDREREKKKPSTAVSSGSYGKFGIITITDQIRMAAEFRAWLVEQRRLVPDAIPRDKFNKEFANFVEDFNNACLPHEKYYNMNQHHARMAALRNGEKVVEVLQYDPRADEKAHVARLRATHLPDQADLTREEIVELRRLEKERMEAVKRRQLGLEIPKGLGVRTIEVPLESSWKDPNLF